MKKSFLFCLSLTFVLALQAQKFYLTPVIGVKADIGSTKIEEAPDYYYFKYSAPRVHAGLSPILLGTNLEYYFRKSIFGIGVIGGDDAGSTIQVNFEVKSDSPYSDYKGNVEIADYSAHNVLKVPLSFKTEMFTINSKQNNTIAKINLHTGLNLMFLKVKGFPRLYNPISWGPYYTLHDDTIAVVGYAGHMNRSFSVSFKLGLDFDFYVKSKRRFNLQFYYEQGTREISQSAIMITKDIEEYSFWQGVSTRSRGSSIQFKLGFPINVVNFKIKQNEY